MEQLTERREAPSAFAFIIKEYFISKNLRELVFPISLISFGSNQTFFLPHFITEAASLFCNLRELER